MDKASDRMATKNREVEEDRREDGETTLPSVLAQPGATSDSG